jgi:hypothetical protein
MLRIFVSTAFSVPFNLVGGYWSDHPLSYSVTTSYQEYQAKTTISDLATGIMASYSQSSQGIWVQGKKKCSPQAMQTHYLAL